ncbi:MAG TPA: substrate-binding domain-containing protein [Burkholderiaceae bacterium]
MLSRRRLLWVPVAGLAGAGGASAQQRLSLGDPLRLGVDRALMESGLAPALLHAFGIYTGIAVKPVPGPALALLTALERGEIDAALTNVAEAEAKLDQQGLAHDRQAIAGGEFVIVGPALRGKGEDVLGNALGHDAAEALKRLAQAASGSFSFLSAADGSGTHLAEQALWRAAGIAPAAPWYVALAPGEELAAQARARGAFAVVERGAWLARGGAPLAIRVDGDPRQAENVHVMRSFRVNHPAGKIFVAWIASAKGRRVVAAQRGYRAPV